MTDIERDAQLIVPGMPGIELTATVAIGTPQERTAELSVPGMPADPIPTATVATGALQYRQIGLAVPGMPTLIQPLNAKNEVTANAPPLSEAEYLFAQRIAVNYGAVPLQFEAETLHEPTTTFLITRQPETVLETEAVHAPRAIPVIIHVAGKVKDRQGNFAQRTVLVLRASDLDCIGETESDPATGEYYVRVPTLGEHIVIALASVETDPHLVRRVISGYDGQDD